MVKSLKYSTPYNEKRYPNWQDEMISDSFWNNRSKEESEEMEQQDIIETWNAIPLNFSFPYLHHQIVKSKFEEFKKKWRSEVRFSSDPDEIISNENYQAIIEMGFEVVPLLLMDMKANHTHWFAALEEIINVNPIKEEHAGNIPEMVKDWLQWSNSNLFIV